MCSECMDAAMLVRTLAVIIILRQDGQIYIEDDNLVTCNNDGPEDQSSHVQQQLYLKGNNDQICIPYTSGQVHQLISPMICLINRSMVGQKISQAMYSSGYMSRGIMTRFVFYSNLVRITS